MIRGIHHAALCARDLDRMVAFYRDVIGFTVVSEYAWDKVDLIDEIIGLKSSVAKTVMLKAGNAYLEIFEYAAPKARNTDPLRPCDRGYTHIALDVVDIRSEYDRLVKAGMQFCREPAELGDIRAVYGKDPEGNIVEIQEVTNPQHAFATERLRN
jgi:catechol 2,3-dioxygenase-like lactoylglutathione lyase family enzyme